MTTDTVTTDTVTTDTGRLTGPLGLDPDKLSACVSCGLCLPHCPTFRVTGEERYSPRGRIDAMRGVERDGAPIDDEFVDFIDTCVQCRGCEPACPSGVEYGALAERTKSVLAERRQTAPWWERLGLRALERHRLLLAGSTALAAAQRLRLVPRRLGLPELPLRRPPALAHTSDHPDVWVLTGCVMDAWQRDTHRSLVRLIEAAGSTWSAPGGGGDCCGALHAHAGLHDDAVRLAGCMVGSMPGDAPVLVDSAGCGAALQHVGELLAGDEAQRFSERVVDASTWLAERVEDLPGPTGTRPTVIVQDPCHLRHVQRAHLGTRHLLARYADIVELDDDGLCCGAGGAFSMMQPELAGEIRTRKLAAIDRAIARCGATTLVSANPGCAMYLADGLDGRLDVRHPVDVVAQAIGERSDG